MLIDFIPNVVGMYFVVRYFVYFECPTIVLNMFKTFGLTARMGPNVPNAFKMEYTCMLRMHFKLTRMDFDFFIRTAFGSFGL